MVIFANGMEGLLLSWLGIISCECLLGQTCYYFFSASSTYLLTQIARLVIETVSLSHLLQSCICLHFVLSFNDLNVLKQ